MSDFGNFIAAQIKEQRTTGGAMAVRMNIDRTHFSAFLNGRRTSCNVETLMLMVKGISDDERIQAGLLEAYFRDQCVERYKAWIQVRAGKGAAAEFSGRVAEEEEWHYGAADPITDLGTLLRRLRLPVEVVESLGHIAAAIPDRTKFRIVIQDLGKFAREELMTAEKAGDSLRPAKEGRAKLCPPPETLKHQETPVRTAYSAKPRGNSTAARGGGNRAKDKAPGRAGAA